MKKILVFLWAMLLVCLMAGAAGAVPFTDEKDLDVFLGWGHQRGTYEWWHQTPHDFEVPYDVVNSASVEIFAKWVDEGDDFISIEGTFKGTLQNQNWVWTGWWRGYSEGQEIDITTLLTDKWDNGQDLGVTLSYYEPGCLDALYLDKSIFTLDYENRDNGEQVPEPSLWLLLGSGILALTGYTRMKFRK